MQLRFLGQTYSSSHRQVDTVAAKHTAFDSLLSKGLNTIFLP